MAGRWGREEEEATAGGWGALGTPHLLRFYLSPQALTTQASFKLYTFYSGNRPNHMHLLVPGHSGVESGKAPEFVMTNPGTARLDFSLREK